MCGGRTWLKTEIRGCHSQYCHQKNGSSAPHRPFYLTLRFALNAKITLCKFVLIVGHGWESQKRPGRAENTQRLTTAATATTQAPIVHSKQKRLSHRFSIKVLLLQGLSRRTACAGIHMTTHTVCVWKGHRVSNHAECSMRAGSANVQYWTIQDLYNTVWPLYAFEDYI